MHHLLLRALLGAAGIIGCTTLLASQAHAAERNRDIIVTNYGHEIAPNLFGTMTLPVKLSKYAEGWRRASEDASYLPAMQRLIEPAHALNRREQLRYVQGAVSRRIRWMSDATEWGRHDYWASARETLQRGAGDQEDRAILKMQALRALGFSRRDLYLTIGKETIGGPPITALLVRVGPQIYWLDDWSGPPIPIERKRDFVPMLSFSGGLSWLHGRRAQMAVRTAASSSATVGAGAR